MTEPTPDAPPITSGEPPPATPIAPSTPPVPVLPVTTTGGLRRLAPPVLVLWLVSAAIWAVIVLLVSSAFDFALLRKAAWWPLPLGAGVVISLVLFVSPVVLLTLLGYKRWGYEIRDRDVLVESGVLWRVRRSLPRSKVQHVDIRSGPVSRALGLVEVHLHAAGSIGPVAIIPGLTPEAAEELRRALVEEAGDGV